MDLTALSLCSGAGGLDLGVEAAGWQVLAQVEIDADSVGTLRHNFEEKGAQVFHNGLEDIDPRELRLKLGLRRGQLGLIVGGPPCQPFTTHGRRRGINDARVSSLFPQYLRYIREFEPAGFLMENVDGILSAALIHRPLHLRTKDCPLAAEELKGSFLKWLVTEMAQLGYSVSWGIVDAVDFGVPQHRQRCILIGVRGGDPCYLPAHSPEAQWSTVRDAIGSLGDPGPIQPLSAAKKAVYALVPPGGNWRNLPVDLQRATMGKAFYATGGKSGWWRRLSWDLPSPTVLGMPDHSSTGLIHPDEVRCLGLWECTTIQTFPTNYLIVGRPRSCYQQVGNAVPPLLAKVVADTIRCHLEGERVIRPSPPAWRKLSANRRIGTHGWLTKGVDGLAATLNVKVREDHVWSRHAAEGNGPSVLVPAAAG